jgi:nucleotide-binding universal stress UspA family protein
MTPRVAEGPELAAGRPEVHGRPTGFHRIAVGVDGRVGGRDAACLAMMLADATGAEVMLVAVLPDPPVPRARQLDRSAMRDRAATVLREIHDLVAPHARTLIETNRSVARALERVVRREHRDLLVLGSSDRAPDGHVRIGRRARQLLGDARCALAVAPRGMCAGGPRHLSTIGVGYDGTRESRAALALAAPLAQAATAELHVLAVVDDRLPGWPRVGGSALREVEGEVQEMWDETIEPNVASLRKDTERAATASGATVTVEVKPGSPPEELIALSEDVDLLVVGSRHWGAAGRVLLGWTGEELMHHAGCPMLLAPRPPSSRAASERAAPKHGRADAPPPPPR